jgi:hypothetical protein
MRGAPLSGGRRRRCPAGRTLGLHGRVSLQPPSLGFLPRKVGAHQSNHAEHGHRPGQSRHDGDADQHGPTQRCGRVPRAPSVSTRMPIAARNTKTDTAKAAASATMVLNASANSSLRRLDSSRATSQLSSGISQHHLAMSGPIRPLRTKTGLAQDRAAFNHNSR